MLVFVVSSDGLGRPDPFEYGDFAVAGFASFHDFLPHRSGLAPIAGGFVDSGEAGGKPVPLIPGDCSRNFQAEEFFGFLPFATGE